MGKATAPSALARGTARAKRGYLALQAQIAALLRRSALFGVSPFACTAHLQQGSRVSLWQSGQAPHSKPTPLGWGLFLRDGFTCLKF